MSYAKWRIFKGFQLCCSYEVAPEETDSSIVPEAEITGGSGGEAVVAAKGENKEEKATSEPKVIVAGCKEIPEHIYAGDSVNLKVVLKNTNKKKYVQNMTVTVGCEGDGISLGNTANTQYYEKLGAGKTLEVPVEIQTDKKTEAGRKSATIIQYTIKGRFMSR